MLLFNKLSRQARKCQSSQNICLTSDPKVLIIGILMLRRNCYDLVYEYGKLAIVHSYFVRFGIQSELHRYSEVLLYCYIAYILLRLTYPVSSENIPTLVPRHEKTLFHSKCYTILEAFLFTAFCFQCKKRFGRLSRRIKYPHIPKCC